MRLYAIASPNTGRRIQWTSASGSSVSLYRERVERGVEDARPERVPAVRKADLHAAHDPEVQQRVARVAGDRRVEAGDVGEGERGRDHREREQEQPRRRIGASGLFLHGRSLSSRGASRRASPGGSQRRHRAPPRRPPEPRPTAAPRVRPCGLGAQGARTRRRPPGTQPGAATTHAKRERRSTAAAGSAGRGEPRVAAPEVRGEECEAQHRDQRHGDGQVQRARGRIPSRHVRVAVARMGQSRGLRPARRPTNGAAPASGAPVSTARPTSASLWPPFTIVVTTAGCRPQKATARALRVWRQISTSRGGNREGRQTLEHEPRRDRHRERDTVRDCDQTRTTADSAPTVNTSAAPTMAGHARPRSFGAAWFTGGVRILLSALECQKGAAAANLASHRRVLVGTRDAGCTFAVFPEMSLTGSVDPSRHEHWLVGLPRSGCRRRGAAHGRARRRRVVRNLRAGRPRRRVHHAGVRRGRSRPGCAAQAPSRRGRSRVLLVGRDAVFALDGAQFTVRDLRRGRHRPAVRARRAPRASTSCASRPRRVSGGGARPRRSRRAGWDWWCDEGLGDLRRHARECGLWIADRDAGRLDLRRGLSGAGGAGRPER